jgi:hypothetical protein
MSMTPPSSKGIRHMDLTAVGWDWLWIVLLPRRLAARRVAKKLAKCFGGSGGKGHFTFSEPRLGTWEVVGKGTDAKPFDGIVVRG